MRRELMMEEPHNPPGTILNTFFNHLTIEGIKQKHMLMLAEQCVNYLAVQEHILEKKWPIEQQIYTIQQTQGAKTIIETIKKKCNKETKEALTALQKRLDDWKQKTTQIKLVKNEFSRINP